MELEQVIFAPSETEIKVILRRAARNFATGKYTMTRDLFKRPGVSNCYCASGGFVQAAKELGYVNPDRYGSFGVMAVVLFNWMIKRNLNGNWRIENALLLFNDDIAEDEQDIAMALNLLSVV